MILSKNDDISDKFLCENMQNYYMNTIKFKKKPVNFEIDDLKCYYYII